MNDFYNGPPFPLWLAFPVVVVNMGLCIYLIRQIRSLSHPPVEVIALGIAFSSIGFIWMPIWFIYGVLTLKFT